MPGRMRTHTLLAGLVCLLSAQPVLAQDRPTEAHRTTTLPQNARFEIVQSQLAARWTFKLDRFTGRVYQLVRDSDDNLLWEQMRVYGNTGRSVDRPRFQLFLSGIVARNTFMIDTETGDTWQLMSRKVKNDDGTESEINVWNPIEQ